MKLGLPSRRTVALSFFAVCVGLTFTLYPVVHFVASAARDKYDSLENFATIIAIVQKHYVDEVDTGTLIDGAIKGMVSSLDPHSAYLTPKDYNELQIDTRGEFGGLGIEITMRDDILTIVTPLEGTPAFRVGVKPGDQIVKIDDKYTKDLSLQECVDQMRGKPGAPVLLTVHRKDAGKLLEFEIIREIIHIRSVKRAEVLDGRYGYIRLVQFQEGSAAEVIKGFEQIIEKADAPLEGVILDLRYNPGGLLTQAVAVSDLFLDSGLIVKIDGRMATQRDRFVAHADGTRELLPMIVLVNEGSASASEIVAGALQDHERALVVGTQTFGKGSVQTILPLGDRDALRLTTALYYTPSGRSINEIGVEPDVLVEFEIPEGEGDGSTDGASGGTASKDGASKNAASKGSSSGEAASEGSASKGASSEDTSSEGTAANDTAADDTAADDTAAEDNPDSDVFDYSKDTQLLRALELLASWKGKIEIIGGVAGFGLGDAQMAKAGATQGAEGGASK